MLVWQLVLIQVATFALLVFLLRQFLYKNVTQVLGRLRQSHQENLKREDELKKKRDEMEQELKVRLALHSEELERLKADAQAETQRMHEEILARAKQEGRKIVAEAEAQKERMRTNLVAEIEEKALGLTAQILEHVFTDAVAKGIHPQLIDDLVHEIGQSNGRLPLDGETVEVIVPSPLTEAQRRKLERILATSLARAVSIRETIDHELVAGVVVRVGNVILDGSLRNKLQRTLEHVRESLTR